jgi:hypothetical protein
MKPNLTVIQGGRTEKPISQVHQIRGELERLGCVSSDWSHGVSACRLWGGIHLYGPCVAVGKTFDFDVLIEILRQFPSQMGEVAFWRGIEQYETKALSRNSASYEDLDNL